MDPDIIDKELKDANVRSTSSQAILDAVLHSLGAVLTIVNHLCSHPDMSTAFMDSTFFEDFTRALHVWMLDRSSPGDDTFRGHQLANSVQVVVENQPVWHGSGHWRLSELASLDLVRAGWVAILVDGMKSIPRNDEGRGAVISQSLTGLEHHCNQYPVLAECDQPSARPAGRACLRDFGFHVHPMGPVVQERCEQCLRWSRHTCGKRSPFLMRQYPQCMCPSECPHYPSPSR